MEWVIEHWQGIVNAVVAVIATAKVLAKLTPTEVDDNFVGKLVMLLDVIGLVGTKTTKR
jgi:uncharacterized membrane protein